MWVPWAVAIVVLAFFVVITRKTKAGSHQERVSDRAQNSASSRPVVSSPRAQIKVTRPFADLYRDGRYNPLTAEEFDALIEPYRQTRVQYRRLAASIAKKAEKAFNRWEPDETLRAEAELHHKNLRSKIEELEDIDANVFFNSEKSEGRIRTIIDALEDVADQLRSDAGTLLEIRNNPGDK